MTCYCLFLLKAIKSEYHDSLFRFKKKKKAANFSLLKIMTMKSQFYILYGGKEASDTNVHAVIMLFASIMNRNSCFFVFARAQPSFHGCYCGDKIQEDSYASWFEYPG